MRSRTFLHVSLGILALAAAYQLGARSAGAQAGGNIVAMTAGNGIGIADDTGIYATTSNGDVYALLRTRNWVFVSNVFAGGGPTPVQHESWGAVKARYRGERAPVTTDR